jgi:hypothetical protein|tara:strand:+ start:3543 stop:3770 length:228 start_codon:yes stop_codon:yes gene_type:complete
MAEKKAKDKKWIQKTEMKKGVFTTKAKRKGITTAQLQENVLANPDEYNAETIKQARLRQTLVGLKKKKDAKKTEG